nr:MAG TPA_asm: hypothetical protein [Caudoviricetes sp.]
MCRLSENRKAVVHHLPLRCGVKRLIFMSKT